MNGNPLTLRISLRRIASGVVGISQRKEGLCLFYDSFHFWPRFSNVVALAKSFVEMRGTEYRNLIIGKSKTGFFSQDGEIEKSRPDMVG